MAPQPRPEEQTGERPADPALAAVEAEVGAVIDAALSASAGPEDPAATGDNLFADPVDYTDSAVLRAMIAEVVRDELRGPLGERITHNLRRLVRQEVARALASREG